MNFRILLCSIGIHKYDGREVHYRPGVIPSNVVETPHKADVLLRCKCGRSRLSKEGTALLTTLVFYTESDYKFYLLRNEQ